MEDLIRLDAKIRNISLIFILIAIIILVVWIIIFIQTPKKEFYYLLYIGMAFFFAGILILTRIQFTLWLEKRAKKKLNNFLPLDTI